VTHLSLSINGMSCSHCLNAVRRVLSDSPGVVVESVRIGRADIQYDPAATDPTRISQAVSEAGYAAAAMPGSDRPAL
jgi:copper chaperone